MAPPEKDHGGFLPGDLPLDLQVWGARPAGFEPATNGLEGGTDPVPTPELDRPWPTPVRSETTLAWSFHLEFSPEPVPDDGWGLVARNAAAQRRLGSRTRPWFRLAEGGRGEIRDHPCHRRWRVDLQVAPTAGESRAVITAPPPPTRHQRFAACCKAAWTCGMRGCLPAATLLHAGRARPVPVVVGTVTGDPITRTLDP